MLVPTTSTPSRPPQSPPRIAMLYASPLVTVFMTKWNMGASTRIMSWTEKLVDFSTRKRRAPLRLPFLWSSYPSPDLRQPSFDRGSTPSRTLNSTLASAAEQLKIIRVANEQHVTRTSTSTVDDTIQLQSPLLSTFKRSPCLHGIVTSGDNNGSASLTRSKSLEQSRSDISALISLAAIIQDTAGLDLTLRSMRSQRANFARKLAEDSSGKYGNSRNEERGEMHCKGDLHSRND